MYRNRLNTSYLITMLILSTISLFFSCKNPTTNNAIATKDSLFLSSDTFDVATENSHIKTYRSFLQQLDSSKAESVSLALVEFKRTFEAKPNVLSDSAYPIFQEFIDSVELHLNEKLLDDTTDYSAFNTNMKLPIKLELAQMELKKNGFKFSTSEGTVYIEQDRSFVTKTILSLFSEPMQAYLLQIEKENREGFMEDAGIIISAQKHVDRIIWYEKFIATNPNFLLIKNCKTYKKAYLTYLFTGIDNTYLYENKDQMLLNPYFSKAYSYLLKGYPDSEAATLILPYKQAIEQKQKSVVSELLKKYVIKGIIYSQGI